VARQPSGKKDASPDDALDDVNVTDEVDAVENSSPSTTDAVDSSDEDVDEDEDVADDEASDDPEDEAEEEDDSTEDDEDEVEVAASADDEASEERTAEAAALWSDVRIEPVEIALPKGVGFTLRAYRMSNELTPVEVVEEEDDAFAVLNRSPVVEEDEEIDFDDEYVDERPGVVQEDAPVPATTTAARRRRGKDADEDDEDETAVVDKDEDSGENDSGDDETDEELADEEELSEAELAEALNEDDEDEEEEEKEPEPEEVPVFLGSGGKLLLFRSPEGLVEFVKSTDEHDLAQLDTWADLRERITVEAIVPNDEDSYELDLVVENLRGGRDAWDTGLLIGAGEAARDLAYALRLEAVRTALSPGSPLDDLDEGLRSSASGGMGGFFARRRLKKIGAQQAALGWRTIIGKISAVVDWRD
jgi:hypothetical protein